MIPSHDLVYSCSTLIDQCLAILQDTTTTRLKPEQQSPLHIPRLNVLALIQMVKVECEGLELCLLRVRDVQNVQEAEQYIALWTVLRRVQRLVVPLRDLALSQQRAEWYRRTGGSKERNQVLKLTQRLRGDLLGGKKVFEGPPWNVKPPLWREHPQKLDDFQEGALERSVEWDAYDQSRLYKQRKEPDFSNTLSDQSRSSWGSDPVGMWQSLKILSLDDNGPKQAMVSLYTLEIFMEYIAEAEQRIQPAADSSSTSPLYWTRVPVRRVKDSHRFRPCHYFDYICGTGTGGMSATLLGMMRFSVPEAIARIEEVLADQPPPIPRPAVSIATPLYIRTRSKDGVLRLRKVLKEQLESSEQVSDVDGRRRDGQLGRPYAQQHALLRADIDQCQTICITSRKVHKGAAKAHILKSFGDQRVDSFSSSSTCSNDSQIMPIVDVCLASAAPLLCSTSVKINGVTFKDATALDVSPTWKVYEEARNHRRVDRIEFSMAIDCHRSLAKKRSLSSHGQSHLPLSSRSSLPTSSPLSSGVCRCASTSLALDPSRHDFCERTKDGLETSFQPPSTNPVTFHARYDREIEKEFPGALHTLVINGDLEGWSARKYARDFCAERSAELHEWAEILVTARRARAKTREWRKFAGLNVPQTTDSPPESLVVPQLPLPQSSK